jgi:hypothetical protein
MEPNPHDKDYSKSKRDNDLLDFPTLEWHKLARQNRDDVELSCYVLGDEPLSVLSSKVYSYPKELRNDELLQACLARLEEFAADWRGERSIHAAQLKSRRAESNEDESFLGGMYGILFFIGVGAFLWSEGSDLLEGHTPATNLWLMLLIGLGSFMAYKIHDWYKYKLPLKNHVKRDSDLEDLVIRLSSKDNGDPASFRKTTCTIETLEGKPLAEYEVDASRTTDFEVAYREALQVAASRWNADRISLIEERST